MAMSLLVYIIIRDCRRGNNDLLSSYGQVGKKKWRVKQYEFSRCGVSIINNMLCYSVSGYILSRIYKKEVNSIAKEGSIKNQ